ncbi:hypothetical protein HDIA_0665 [Hartmannibacter diazotrophicus]|uniref:Polyketide cyclase n=1 Tax=Hartmannibacter diazotrophicus TaxID=1482074 RepID=A0A2C9D1T5_9HYPH|nr:SRPBCC domain-containing protein [Hartmannibacter diazotrophicus]SON54206.1 hypothetical protein HDIA_0665 [Hartmannibacter diazotrophicus]
MSNVETDDGHAIIELEYDLDEPPQKVWRAISIPEFRDHWLPPQDLADSEAAIITPGRELRYTLRDGAPPFVESTVTFTVLPNGIGGTHLRIVHVPADGSFPHMIMSAANSNDPPLLRVA